MTAEHSPAPPSHHLALANLVSFFDNAFAQEPTEQVPLLDVLERIRAGIWGALKGVPFSAREVAMFMVCVKLSRETHQRKRDNWVDIAGYAKCGSLCGEGAA